MANFNTVSVDVFNRPATVKTGRTISPEIIALRDVISTIIDDTIVYEFDLPENVKPLTFRQQILRAAKLTDVNVVVRKSDAGFYVGLLTDARKSNRGRKPAATVTVNETVTVPTVKTRKSK